MLRLLGILMLALALAFASGATAQGPHTCADAATLAPDHAGMAHSADATGAATSSPHPAPLPAWCKHGCAPAALAVVTFAVVSPRTLPGAARLQAAETAPSLAPLPADRPPKRMI